jgi:signal transduction histidine kinase
MTDARDDLQPRSAARPHPGRSHLARRQHRPGGSPRGQAAQPRNAAGRLARPEPGRPAQRDQPPLDLPGQAGRAGRAGQQNLRRRGLAAPYALPVGAAALLVTGAVAAAAHGAVSAGWVLLVVAVIVSAVALIAEPGAALFVVLAGWLTTAGFSGPPYAQLRVTWASGSRSALVLGCCALAGVAVGSGVRRLTSSFTLFVVTASDQDPSDRNRLIEARAQAEAWIESADPDGRTLPLPADEQPLASDQRSAAAASTAAASRAAPDWRRRLSASMLGWSSGLGRRRQIAGVLLVFLFPLVTAALLPGLRSRSLSLSDDLLIFLVCVVGVAVVGGFWPAVLAAVTASLLLNWFFTPPVHTFTIADPQNMLALLLFVTVAVSVSSVVHLAARRAVQAARSAEDAAALLALAQTVLGGSDTPAAILRHLTETRGGRAELLERVGGQWIKVAAAGPATSGPATAGAATAGAATTGPATTGPATTGPAEAGPATASPEPAARTSVRAGADLALVVSGQADPITPRLLDGFAAQAAAALDRDRLRTQAAQAEALAEGNRMRTALLAAVSHDLRTPLASIKASVSTVRQDDVELTEDDEASLLATIEQSADRLNGLIGNLLDMSRLSTGSLEPFLRPASIDEVAPLAHPEPGPPGGTQDAPASIQLIVPDDLPLVRTDPGLLERVLANLFSNAIQHSPPGRPPMMVASRESHRVGHHVGHHESRHESRHEGHRQGQSHRERQVVIIDVIDHGNGVPDEHKPLIFEPFERLGDRNTGTGVGLGLAVAKGFLQAMGGEIEALDTPGGGLTMRVTLPIAAPPALTPAPTRAPTPAPTRAPTPAPAPTPALTPTPAPAASAGSVLAADK